MLLWNICSTLWSKCLEQFKLYKLYLRKTRKHFHMMPASRLLTVRASCPGSGARGSGAGGGGRVPVSEVQVEHV